MAVVVLASAAHSPGVTTAALALALTWPGDILLADCDRTPSQAVLAGYLHGVDPHGRGLTGVLQAHREHRPLEEVLDSECLSLDPTDPISRTFLPGLSHPGTVALFASAWPDLMAALARHQSDVLIDAGRVGVDGLPSALTTAADLVLIVTRTTLVSLAALRLYLPMVTESSQKLGLLVVGDGQPYRASEVQAQFGVDVWGSIQHDPASAAVLSEGLPAPRRFTESRFYASAGEVSRRIESRLREARALIGAPR
ncbi:MAG: hypothetical protein WAS07_00065 [Micropruina sp.]